MAQNQAALRKLAGMSREQKLEYFATAKRVTVGTITQMIDTTPGKAVFKTSYVPKIRGCFVGNANNYKHETPGLALSAGKTILAQWRAEFTGSNTACTGIAVGRLRPKGKI